MKAQTHLTTKGQVVIPKAVRDRLKWRSGTLLEVEAADDGTVKLRAASEDLDSLVDRLSGCLAEGDALAELEAEHRAEVKADERLRSRR